MTEPGWLAAQFETNRNHLRAVAYRILGSRIDADDAVQEAWLRLARSDTSDVENLRGWLTTVVARVCLNMLQSRTSRREQPLDAGTSAVTDVGEIDPEHEALLADSVGIALLVVLDALTPAERLAFVLHDLFDVPFEQIGTIVGRSPAAARQLASRARRRARAAAGSPDADLTRQRSVVDAFLAASRRGDFTALLALLDPDVVLRADRAAVQVGSIDVVRGAAEVAASFAGRARAARPALLDGAAAAVWAPHGQPRVVFAFTISGGRIAEIELLAEPATLAGLDLTILDG